MSIGVPNLDKANGDLDGVPICKCMCDCCLQMSSLERAIICSCGIMPRIKPEIKERDVKADTPPGIDNVKNAAACICACRGGGQKGPKEIRRCVVRCCERTRKRQANVEVPEVREG